MPWYKVYANCVAPLEIEADSEEEALDMVELENFEWHIDIYEEDESDS